MRLEDAYKKYTLDLDKVVPPAETVRRFREKLKTLDLDILEETVRIDNGRLGIPVYFSVCGKDAAAVIGTRKQMGKGGTPEQAEASAVMELVERFSLYTFMAAPENFFTETYPNLKDHAIPFEAVARSVHDESEDRDRALEVFSRLPLRWARGHDLTRDEPVLVPFDWFFAINEFNGSSAGNCREEALLQGICEVVERHVSSLVSRNRVSVPAIDLDSVRDPLAADLIRKYRVAGIRLFASDFSLDTGIPTVAVLAYDPVTFPAESEIVWTAGTTPNPEKSLIRALTEVAQLAGDFNTGGNYVASGLPKFTDLSAAAYVMEPGRTVAIGTLPDLSHDNIRIETEKCVRTLAGRGMPVFAVDVTHPRLGIPAIYTMVPGAHFRERAAGTGVGMFAAKLVAEAGDPAWAVRELTRMEKVLPGRYYIRFYLGQSHLALNDPSTALACFEQALDMGPNREDIPGIYSYMAVALKEMERYRDAIAVLEKAEACDRDRTDIHNLMGFCYFKLKEHEKAIRCFRNVIRINPASAIDYANIASNYRDMGDRDQAIRYYRLALELDPDIDFARRNLQALDREPPRQAS